MWKALRPRAGKGVRPAAPEASPGSPPPRAGVGSAAKVLWGCLPLAAIPVRGVGRRARPVRRHWGLLSLPVPVPVPSQQ